jgi:hypothetical protein
MVDAALASRWNRPQGLWVLPQVLGQELEGDVPAKIHILGFVHHTHSTTTHLLDNAVMQDRLVDQERTLVFSITLRQVNGGPKHGWTNCHRRVCRTTLARQTACWKGLP